MTLADYRISPAVNVDFAEPFATRLLGLLDHFDGRLLILSGVRTTAEQRVLYELRKEYEAEGTEQWQYEHPGQAIPAVAAVPGTSNHEHRTAADLTLRWDLTWRLVHAEAELRGLRFPVAGEAWHCEPDLVWIDPQQEKPMDIEWRILAPIGTLARFIALFARTPDREGWAAVHATWLPTKAYHDWWIARGAVEHAIPIGELAGVTLIGGLPHGDVYPWSTSDWQSVA